MDIPSYVLGKKAGGGGGSNYQSKSVEITENGTTNITADTGYDALSEVDVTVSGILDTSDADAVASDMATGKTAYVNGTKITGNVPVGSSSVATNYASNNVGTYLDELKVDTEQGNQNQMFRTGDKISVYAPLSTVATTVGATAEKIKKDEVICGVTGTYEGGGRDWSAIGYSGEPETIVNGYNYAKNIYDNWDSSVTSMPSSIRDSRGQILFFPGLDMSNITGNGLYEALGWQYHLIEVGPIIVSNKCTTFARSFYQNYSLEKFDFSNIDLSNIASFEQTFYNCSCLKNLKNIKNKSVDKLTSIVQMFYSCSSIEEIDLSGWQNTDLLKNIYSAFYNCTKVKTIKLNLKKLENLTTAFQNCAQLENIEFGNDVDGSDIYNINNAFSGCNSLNNNTLNRILALCIDITKPQVTKTLKYIGLSSAQATTCQTLSNWQALANAGWTTGY